jgi:hypothetical protein
VNYGVPYWQRSKNSTYPGRRTLVLQTSTVWRELAQFELLGLVGLVGLEIVPVLAAAIIACSVATRSSVKRSCPEGPGPVAMGAAGVNYHSSRKDSDSKI